MVKNVSLVVLFSLISVFSISGPKHETIAATVVTSKWSNSDDTSQGRIDDMKADYMLAYATVGGLVGSLFGPVGAVVGAAAGAYAGCEAYGETVANPATFNKTPLKQSQLD